MKNIVKLLALLAAPPLLAITLQPGQYRELGNVRWERDYHSGLTQAQKQDKPVFLLFQEVPGCAGCQAFGQNTLSNPLIVDAIEESFVPVAVFNNQGGADREVLEKYNEPAWNYQVIRFVNSEGKDILPREDNVWTDSAVAARMIEALEQYGHPVPDYLRTVAWQGQPGLQTATFAMFCFWDGESKLGAIDGVTQTEAGWLDGREVVKLRFDPEVVSFLELSEKASRLGCDQRIYAPDQAALETLPAMLQRKATVFVEADYRRSRESDQKRQLRRLHFTEIELNAGQQTKINAALATGNPQDMIRWLSPTQLAKLRGEPDPQSLPHAIAAQ